MTDTPHESLAVVSRESPIMVNPESLIAAAIERGVPVETMEKLLAMRRELKAEAAKEAFFAALSAFQSECPTIKKTKVVYNKDGKTIRYRYAPLETIVEQVSPFLKKHGFSYTLDSQIETGSVKAVCVAHHIAGHSETFTFAVPVDNDAYMSPAQRVGSALTFASRYAFKNAFGILTGDEDDDANGHASAPASTPTPARPTPPKATAPAPAESPEDRRKRFLALFKGKESYATDVFRYNNLILLTEEFQDIDDSHIPKTVKQVKDLVAAVDRAAGIDDQIPGAEAGPEGTKHGCDGEASAPAPDDEWWRGVIVPIPHRGERRDEYLKHPDTIGSLFDVRHDDPEACQRLWGFLNHFEPKPWTGKDGKERPPNTADLKFRQALDDFGEWFEKHHPDEKL